MAVRLRQEGNNAYDDQPEPLHDNQLLSEIKPVDATKRLEDVPLELTAFVDAEGAPRVEANAEQIRSATGEAYGVELRVHNARLGRHVFGPNTAAVQLETLGDRSKGSGEPLQIEAYRPEHLDLRPTPEPLPEWLRTPTFLQTDLAPGDRKPYERGNRATTVFPPENRSTLWSTAYPWSACGRVDTALGWASGVMVGPRHLLTCSHVVQWLPGNSTGWMRFRPCYFDGSAPFGDAWATLTYYKMKVSGPTIDLVEGMYDYVVVVLNRRLGDITGWHGSRGYTDSWDGGNYWTHVGYPGDLSGGNRPYFQNGVALDGAWWQFDSHEAMSHQGDVWPGQSGGPFFGWWQGDVGPRAVAVQSSHNSSENNASGGQDLVDLVIQARGAHP